jgi:hypothetical protein
MPALSGLTGLYGDLDTAPAGTIDEGAYQVYEQGTPDPSHAKTGDTSGQEWPAGYGEGYSGQGTYAENESGQLAEWATTAGIATFNDSPDEGAIDKTPSSHGGQYPRPEADKISTIYPDTLAVVGQQLRLLHGNDQGGVRAFTRNSPGGKEAPTDTTVDRYDAPNVNSLAKLTGAQRATGYPGMGGNGGGQHLGTADVDQGYGELNSHPEFQAGHSIRIVQHDEFPFDHTGLGDAAEGSWYGKHPLGTAQSFDGPDSPYGADGDTKRDQQRPEIRGFPTEYIQPAPPTVRSTPVLAVDVWASGAF